ncbi:MAG: hypothetical protein AAB795_02540, partial [Patescibacteria group bacterium]
MDQEKDLNEKRPPAIRTMRTDAEMYAKEKKLSTIQISASAYASQATLLQDVKDKLSLIKTFLLSGAIVLCIVIVAGVSWWFLSHKSSSSQSTEKLPPPAIILIDGQNILTIKQANKSSIISAISEERAKTFRSGILNYYPIKVSLSDNTTTYLQIKDLGEFLEWRMPSLLLENLTSDFNAYIFANNQSNDFALIIKTSNFEKAFSSMLEWEKTLARDWQDFLNDTNKNIAYPNAFRDEIIKNNDARILLR